MSKINGSVYVRADNMFWSIGTRMVLKYFQASRSIQVNVKIVKAREWIVCIKNHSAR